MAEEGRPDPQRIRDIIRKYNLNIPPRPAAPLVERPAPPPQRAVRDVFPRRAGRPRERGEIVILPNRSVGGLALGMPLAEADGLLRRRHAAAERDGLVRCPCRCGGARSGGMQYFCYTVTDNEIYHIVYKNGLLYEINLLDCAEEAAVILNGVELFGRGAEDVMTRLAQTAPYTWESYEGYANEMWANTYKFPTLGVELWREHAYHPDMEREEWFRAQPEEEKEYLRQYRGFNRVTLRAAD